MYSLCILYCDSAHVQLSQQAKSWQRGQPLLCGNIALCPGDKRPSTAINSPVNLKKHLDLCHSTTKLIIRPTEQEGDDGPTALKQQRLEFMPDKAVTPRELNELIAEYVVDEMLPISTVESSSFCKIISTIPVTDNKEGTVSDRKTFADYLDKAYSNMECMSHFCVCGCVSVWGQ